MQREVEKLPDFPVLNEENLKDLTALCFRHESDLTTIASDVVFIFGSPVSSHKNVEVIRKVVRQVNPKKLVISGGMPVFPDSYKLSRPESEIIYEQLRKSLPQDLTIYLEKTSNNSIENVKNSFSHLKNEARIIFVTKSFGAGRHYLTLKKFLPYSEHLQQTFDAFYPENSIYITRDEWHKNDYTRRRVWGEFLRIVKYGTRGDIAYEEVRPLAEKIMGTIK